MAAESADGSHDRQCSPRPLSSCVAAGLSSLQLVCGPLCGHSACWMFYCLERRAPDLLRAHQRVSSTSFVTKSSTSCLDAWTTITRKVPAWDESKRPSGLDNQADSSSLQLWRTACVNLSLFILRHWSIVAINALNRYGTTTAVTG